MKKKFLKGLERRIARHRKELGVTQVEMAEKFGCSQSMIAGYESGIRRLPVSFLPELAKMFEISVDELLGYSPGKKKAKLKKPGPPSKLERQLTLIQKLPRKEREFVVRMLDNALANAG